MTNIYFETLGCSLNVSETEVMKGLLFKNGFNLVESPDDAYIIVVNICTVKGDNTALKTIRKLYEAYPNKKYVIAGCITKGIIPKIREIVPECSLISTHNIKDIVSIVEETMNENPILVLAESKEEKINMPKIRKNNTIGIIPISSGCLGYCSYCSVRIIKGKLQSYPVEKILKEAQKAINDGCKELWLTSQDTGSYGRDINTNLVNLLKEIVKIDKKFMIRVGMMNPNHALEMLDDLIEIYKNEKIFKFVHIPVQSGNNDILKLMKRQYAVEDFIKIVETFRKNIDRITISTDIIAGFPTETKGQFQDSVKLIDKIKPDVLNISRYSLREATEAAKMKQLLGEETKERSRMLTQSFDWTAFSVNKTWEKWTGKILIDEVGKNNTSVGRNFAYKPVVVEGIYKLGDEINVKIIDATKHYLIGQKIN
jgi:MiaB-like tRNA modifying enzyme